MSNEELKITVNEGKYTFILHKGDWRIHCLRHGEPWVVIEQGHKAIISLLYTLQDAEETLKQVRDENANLKKFVREFVEVECWGYAPTVDGGDVQDVAEKMGIIVSVKATQEDADRLNDLHGTDMEEGDVFYRWPDWMKE